jgi:hypothetical protein
MNEENVLRMRRFLSELAGVLAVFFILSCQSTGSTSGANATVNANTETEERQTLQSVEEQVLTEIYDRYESKIILTGATVYTVVWGDTLSRIARRNYGTGDNPYYFPLIIAASKESTEILDPDSIEVGMQLTIPDLQANLNNPAARANLKNLLKDVADFYAGKAGAQSRGLYNGLIRLYDTL